MPTTTTGYGWTASDDPADFGGLITVFDAPGQSAPIRVRKNLYLDGKNDGILGDLFTFVAWRLHNIEPATEGNVNDEWSYYFKKNSNDPNSYSQHAGGLAFDWNAMQHPNNAGPYTGWSTRQVAQIRALLAEVEYVIRWGSDYNDSMHFEIAKGVATDAGKAKIARVVARLRAIMKANPEDFGGRPLPKPTPPPAAKPTPAPAPAPPKEEDVPFTAADVELMLNAKVIPNPNPAYEKTEPKVSQSQLARSTYRAAQDAEDVARSADARAARIEAKLDALLAAPPAAPEVPTS